MSGCVLYTSKNVLVISPVVDDTDDHSITTGMEVKV